MPYNWLFVAMAHWQLDHKEKAKQWCDTSRAWQTTNAAKADAEPFLRRCAELMGATAAESGQDSQKP